MNEKQICYTIKHITHVNFIKEYIPTIYSKLFPSIIFPCINFYIKIFV